LNVTAPPPPVPPQVITAAPTLAERLKNEVSDIYFDFDKYYLREDARAALEKDAQALKLVLSDFPATTVVLEGRCDERGSAEYNLGLGDRRASSVKEFLNALGLPGPRLVTVSYGKEHPQCMESNENCWQLNRRVHFAPGETQKVLTKSEELR
jgi:peptidoglycan-associated lipoprotein